MINGSEDELCVIRPLSAAEFRSAKKSTKGLNALLDLFDRNKYPFFFDPGRPSYV